MAWYDGILNWVRSRVGNAADNFLGLAPDGSTQFDYSLRNNNEQAQIDRDWQEKMFNLSNLWNSPDHQMKLMRDAGLNPSLMYGQMSDLSASVPSGAQASSPSGSAGRVDSLLGLGTDIAVLPAQIDLLRAQAAETRSRIPVNEKKPVVMQATIDQMASQVKLNLEKVNSEQSVQHLNKVLGEKSAEETRRIAIEISQMVESFPVKIEQLNATINELNSRGEMNTQNARVAKETADNYVKDIQQRWKNMNAQIELMKAQKLDAYSSALLKSNQAEYYAALKEYQDIMNDVKGDTAKAEAITGVISRLLGACSGVISAIASVRSGVPAPSRPFALPGTLSY